MRDVATSADTSWPPAPTGGRRPMDGWRDGVGAREIDVGPLQLHAGACAWVVYFAERLPGGTVLHELAHGWDDNAGAGDPELAAEDAAFALLRAGAAAWWRRSTPAAVAPYCGDSR